MYKNQKGDDVSASNVVGSNFKEKLINAAKGGFLLLTGVLAVQIFMKAVYFANL